MVERDLANTVAATPARSTATTVNSMVPAAPVSGSWVMDLTFKTVLLVVLTCWSVSTARVPSPPFVPMVTVKVTLKFSA